MLNCKKLKVLLDSELSDSYVLLVTALSICRNCVNKTCEGDSKMEAKELAVVLHDMFCTANHTDGCAWEYHKNKPDRWETCHDHKSWLEKAEAFLRMIDVSKPEGTQCQKCGEYGEDRRTLRMACLYDMGELGLPFEKIRKEMGQGGAEYRLTVCKDCRGSWMEAIKNWFNKRKE